MTQSQSTTNIIKEVPQLNQFEVEYEGNKFDCNKCREKEKCCGTEDDQFTFQLQCKKCRCQHLHDVLDDSRTQKVTQNGCDDCDDSKFTQTYCQNLGHLNNNLKANITDCSNNFLNLGSNATISDVELRSECNIGGERSVSIFKTDDEEEVLPGTTIDLSFTESIPVKSLLIGGIVGILFLILLFLFT